MYKNIGVETRGMLHDMLIAEEMFVPTSLL